MAPRMKMDTAEFNRTLSKYMAASKKTLPEIVNTKAFFTAQGAMKKTKQADKKEIRRWVKDWHQSAATIIKSYKLKRGQFTRADYIKKMIKFRTSRVGYLQAGWISALKVLGKMTRLKPFLKGMGKQKGKFKGKVIAGKRDSINPQCTIINSTGFTEGQARALKRYGEPALIQALKAESASMKQYVEKKMREAGRRVGVRS